tara:strand:- start:342 stop:737 length:396 start_codon:yes stop_codon:yes gene_type:complete
MVYGIFRDPDNKFKNLEEIVVNIEKYSYVLDWTHANIQSALWNFENPKIDKETIDFFVKDLRDNFNKREEAHAKYYYYKYVDLRAEMFRLFITGTPDSFLEDLERLKKNSGINNIWKYAEDNNWLKKNEKK